MCLAMMAATLTTATVNAQTPPTQPVDTITTKEKAPSKTTAKETSTTPEKVVESPDAKYDRLIQESLAFYKMKRYDDAIRLLDEAYAIKPTPNITYNKARIYEDQGKFKEALETYRTFVKSPGVQMSNRKLAVERIKALEEIVNVVDKKEEKPKEAPKPQVVVQQPQPKPQPKAQDGGSNTGTIFFTLGVVAALGGGVAGVVAWTQHSDLNNAASLEARRDAASTVDTTSIVADSLFVAGGALMITGIVFWLLDGPAEEKPNTALAPTIGPDGAGVTFQTRF